MAEKKSKSFQLNIRLSSHYPTLMNSIVPVDHMIFFFFLRTKREIMDPSSVSSLAPYFNLCLNLISGTHLFMLFFQMLPQTAHVTIS